MTDPSTPTKPVDPRAIVGGVLAALALVCGTVLAALDKDAVHVASLFALATTALGYVFGLYSEPRD